MSSPLGRVTSLIDRGVADTGGDLATWPWVNSLLAGVGDLAACPGGDLSGGVTLPLAGDEGT